LIVTARTVDQALLEIENRKGSDEVVRRRLLFCFLVASSLTGVVLTSELRAYQARRNPELNQQRSSSNPASRSYSTEPFEINARKLPPNYPGHDIVACYNRLKKAAPPKGEYETTAQYVARVNSLSTDYLYAFRVKPRDASFELEYTYDADKKLLVASLEVTRIDLGFVPEFDGRRTADSSIAGITVRDTKAGRDTYVGSNAYGAKTTVTRFVRENYNIAFDKELPQGISWMKLTISITPNEARILKPRLSVLLICKLKTFADPPLLAFECYKFLDPTIHSPIDSFTTKKYIHTDLKAIWLYDTVTGEVLARHTPQ
jgi:hypothetical protein